MTAPNDPWPDDDEAVEPTTGEDGSLPEPDPDEDELPSGQWGPTADYGEDDALA